MVVVQEAWTVENGLTTPTLKLNAITDKKKKMSSMVIERSVLFENNLLKLNSVK